MSLHRLRAREMVSLTGPLVEPKSPERTALEAIPELAVFLSHVDAAHYGLLSSQGRSIADRQGPLVPELLRWDGRHDNCWRVLHHITLGCVFLLRLRGEHKRADAMLALHDDMLPQGLDVVRLSYRSEVGESAMMLSRLTDEQLEQLDDTPIIGGRLSDILDELREAAGELGRLVDERAETRQSSDPGTMSRARSAWLRTITLMRNVAAVIPIDDPTVHGIFARFNDAANRAEQRAQSGGGEADDEPADGDSDSDGTPDDVGDGTPDDAGDGTPDDAGDAPSGGGDGDDEPTDDLDGDAHETASSV